MAKYIKNDIQSYLPEAKYSFDNGVSFETVTRNNGVSFVFISFSNEDVKKDFAINYSGNLHPFMLWGGLEKNESTCIGFDCMDKYIDAVMLFLNMYEYK